MKNILDTIINRINKGNFDFKSVMKKRTFYGHRCEINPLFCSYGQIGWSIYTDFGNIQYDYELKTIERN